jgi:hypothetical protein
VWAERAQSRVLFDDVARVGCVRALLWVRPNSYSIPVTVVTVAGSRRQAGLEDWTHPIGVMTIKWFVEIRVCI